IWAGSARAPTSACRTGAPGSTDLLPSAPAPTPVLTALPPPRGRAFRRLGDCGGGDSVPRPPPRRHPRRTGHNLKPFVDVVAHLRHPRPELVEIDGEFDAILSEQAHPVTRDRLDDARLAFRHVPS